MANRQQRRAGKRLLNRPELKQYVDKFCMDISTMLIDSCEQAKKEADTTNTKIDFSKIQDQLEIAMKSKGEDLGNKVKQIIEKNKQPTFKVNIRTKLVN